MTAEVAAAPTNLALGRDVRMASAGETISQPQGATMKRVQVKNQFKQYLRRMKSYVGRRNPLTLQAALPAKLTRAVRGLTPAQLKRRPRPGKWSIQEIVGHLADTEIVYGFRLRMMLAQSGCPLQAYDQERWAANLGYTRQPISQLLERVRVLRGENLRLLQRVPRPWWNRYGMHAERGRESVRRTIVLLAGHDINHLNQIRAIRQQFGWLAPRAAARGVR